MRLSLVFELLLIFLLIAFSAYARVIDQNEASLQRSARAANKSSNTQNSMTITLPSLKQAEETMNKHCYCNENICNCCREFHIPLVQLNGPGCASLQYLQGDNLQVQLSFGNSILTTGVINGRNPKPVCVTLPGGYSKFCGKIYSIKREADRHFKACLGLELQSSNELEASLRVSCFRFGPDGLKLRPAEEFPIEITPAPAEEDDDDDLFGLGDDDDDDDDEDEDDEDGVNPAGNVVSNTAGEEEEDDDDDEDDDVLGFEALLDIFTGDDDTTKKPKVTTPLPIIPPFTIPFLTTPSSSVPQPEASNIQQEIEALLNQASSLSKPEEPVTVKVEPVPVTESHNEDILPLITEPEVLNIATETIEDEENEAKKPESAEQVEQETVKPEKVTADKNKHKKVTKPSVTSTSANAITNEVKKPLVRPSTPDPAINDVIPHEEHEEEDDDDEDDILGTEDLDEEDEDDSDEKYDENEDEEEEEDEDEEHEEITDAEEGEDTKDEDLEDELDDDDDDDEEEEEVLTALVEGDKKTKTKTKHVNNKNSNKINEAGNQEEDDADYGYSLAELLARKTHNTRSRGRQNKAMRL